jgi:hypothetical protein
VIVFRDGYDQAGFMPVKCSPDAPQTVDIMLLKKDGSYNFVPWDNLQSWNAKAFGLLTSGIDQATARSRCDDLKEQRPAVLACFFNIVTAVAAIPFRREQHSTISKK